MPRQKMIRDPQTGLLTPANTLTRQDSINNNTIVEMTIDVPISKNDVVEGYKQQLADSGQPLQPDEATDIELLQDAIDVGYISQSGKNALENVSELEHEILAIPAEKYGISLASIGDMSHIRDRDITFLIDNSGSMHSGSGLKKNLLSGIVRNYLVPDSDKVKHNGFPCPNEEISRAQEAIIASKQYLEVALSYNNTSKTRYLNLITFSKTLNIKIPVYKKAQDKIDFQISIFYKIDEINFNTGTPLLKTLNANISKTPTLKIIFTDGADPNSGTPVNHNINGKIVECSTELLSYFQNKPIHEVVTIRKCTNGPEANWGEVPDEKADNVDTIDDDPTEGLEIEDMQGPGFFKTQGLLISKALCPHIKHYDNLDQKTLNASELSKLYGRDIAPKSKEYIRFLAQAVVHRINLPSSRDGSQVLAKIDSNQAKEIIQRENIILNEIKQALKPCDNDTTNCKTELNKQLQALENVLSPTNNLLHGVTNMNIGGRQNINYNQGPSQYPIQGTNTYHNPSQSYNNTPNQPNTENRRNIFKDSRFGNIFRKF